MDIFQENVPDIDRMLLCQLAGEAACADEQIVEAMVAAHRAGLYRLACSILRDPDEAEDAVQATFVRAALGLGRYTPGSNFKAWLFTIAVNVCRGMLRKRKARQALERLLRTAPDRPAPAGPPEDQAAQNEDYRQIRAAVEQLDEKHRLVVVLRFEGGMSIEEIAQALAIPKKTVYSRLYEAFQRLRRQLAENRPAGKQPVEERQAGLPGPMSKKEHAR